MYLSELRVQNLRNIIEARIDLAPGLNLFLGPNGSGKTSVLEAAFLLSHGGSFRTRLSEHLIRRGSSPLSVFGICQVASAAYRLGLLRESSRWVARIDGVTPESLTSLFEHCSVVCFEPGSHELISGAAQLRRQSVDWGVFHVEHDYVAAMRRFRRALRQRNAAIRERVTAAEFEVWTQEFCLAAELVQERRARYVDAWQAELLPLLGRYLPELGAAALHFRRGWDESQSLGEALAQTREREQVVGHAVRGPHRADWRIAFALAPSREQLSRGQEKLCALACQLAQARVHFKLRGDWPIIALDDLCSELDRPHQATVLEDVSKTGAQILLTGTDVPESLLEPFEQPGKFHVEQGRIQALL